MSSSYGCFEFVFVLIPRQLCCEVVYFQIQIFHCKKMKMLRCFTGEPFSHYKNPLIKMGTTLVFQQFLAKGFSTEHLHLYYISTPGQFGNIHGIDAVFQYDFIHHSAR